MDKEPHQQGGTENAFIFTSCHYNVQGRSLELSYAYEDGAHFTEQLSFPGAKCDFTPQETEALDKAMKALHLAAGISYYKAYCPDQIIIENQSLSQSEVDFFNKFYLHGLGEFSVENNLDLTEKINFPVSSHIAAPTASPLILPTRDVVPIGGGKDSIVSLEILKKAGHTITTIAVNAGQPILDVMACSGEQEPILIRRRIDPALFLLKDKGAYNGHVPITGILSFVMAFGAIVYGYTRVIMSNEQSANEGNMIRYGMEINHQYSKSLAFEQDFSRYIKAHVLQNFHYFSLLRPLSESGIACLFARLEKYFTPFKSCNRNFHIDEGVRRYGWCCECPKCRFVYLALAPFVGKEKLITIFGQDMLDDGLQEKGFRELLGLEGHKPFECVGEIKECRLLMKSLSLRQEWSHSRLVDKLSAEIDEEALTLEDMTASALSLSDNHRLPQDYLELLNDAIRS